MDCVVRARTYNIKDFKKHIKEEFNLEKEDITFQYNRRDPQDTPKPSYCISILICSLI